MRAMSEENNSLKSASHREDEAAINSTNISDNNFIQSKAIKVEKPLTKEELKRIELARKRAERSRVSS